MTIIDTNIIEARYDELLLMPASDLLAEAHAVLPEDDTLACPTEEELVNHLLVTEFGSEALNVAKASYADMNQRMLELMCRK